MKLTLTWSVAALSLRLHGFREEGVPPFRRACLLKSIFSHSPVPQVPAVCRRFVDALCRGCLLKYCWSDKRLTGVARSRGDGVQEQRLREEVLLCRGKGNTSEY